MLKELNKLTLREQVLEELRSAILSGELPPGTHLGESSLSSQLQVSRGTIREALRALEQAGIVERAPRGLQVKIMGAREINDLYATRGALESLAMTTIMNSSVAQERIEKVIHALPPSDQSTMSFTESMAADFHFHETLIKESQNEVLIPIWNELQDRMRITILAERFRSTQELMSRERHEPIVEAMVSGDRQAAASLLEEHMSDAARLISQK